MKKLFLFSVRKKRLFVWVFSIVFIVGLLVTSLFFVDIKPTNFSMAQKSLSEYRKNYYFGTCDIFSVTFTTGKREDPYVYDGSKGRLVEYGVITVKFKAGFNEVPKYVIIIDSWQYTGSFLYNPFDDTFVADIENEVSVNSDIYVKVFNSGMSKSLQLTCVSDSWNIDYKKALKIATSEFAEELKVYYSKRKFMLETYIKIVADSYHSMENVYWYIYFLCKNGDSLICLINPISGEIIVRKVNLIA